MTTLEVKRDGRVIASGVDDEPAAGNERLLYGWQKHSLFWICVVFTLFHLVSLNFYPIETWAYRIVHVAGGLVIGFAMLAPWSIDREPVTGRLARLQWVPLVVAAVAIGWAAICIGYAFYAREIGGLRPPRWVFGPVDVNIFGGAPLRLSLFGVSLTVGTAIAIAGSWLFHGDSRRVHWSDWLLALSAVLVGAYLLLNLDALRLRAGVMPVPADFWVTMAGVALVLELTRRAAGLALVSISVLFIAYSFLGPYLPGFLEHQGFTMARFFTYIYTDNGILGPTTAVSSTYIILFITFAAFLQASKVGDYFVNFAFAAAGRARGGPAKVAVFASGLMGTINGTSAGNVVATGSLTIPLMKKVGYRPQSAGAIEAAASTGGQIMPPIMGAGAFIMAEVTGIPYSELVIAAIIPAVLYFISIYFMVDLEAARTGMRGLRQEELPVMRELIKQAYLFFPVIMLIYALFMGYSVIRAGTLALVAAAVVSWLTPHRMGPVRIMEALSLAARMAIQMIAVCACAGIIVGVIALTGVGARFSSMLLQVAEHSQLLAMLFAMCIAILLGMGMPTTAAYAVAASVVAPGLIQLGIPVLTAHFFVFYFAVISAITPPVALASYAGAAIAGADPMRTSVTSFKLGLAAFIVPFMFFYSPAMLMQGSTLEVIHVVITATIGIYLLAASVQGWFMGRLNPILRAVLLVAALSLIEGGWMTDLIGIGLATAAGLYQRAMVARQPQAAE